MTTQEPFTLRWGILAFSRDLLIDPTTRNVHDIRHTIVAAASSTSRARAQSFLDEIGAPSTAKAYGTYADLTRDKSIDIIYIATPHSLHYANARMVLAAGKHVLIEKPMTLNAAQCRVLMAVARERGLFMMEAVWTRFFPLTREVCEVVRRGELGEVKRVYADFAVCTDVETHFGTDHRMVKKSLGGSALLDLGIYSLTWIFMMLYQHQHPDLAHADPKISSAMSLYPPTLTDEQTTILLHFPTGAHAIASTSLRVATCPNAEVAPQDAVRIQGTRGDLTVDSAARPRVYRVVPVLHGSGSSNDNSSSNTNGSGEGKGSGSGSGSGTTTNNTPQPLTHKLVTKYSDIPGHGHGMFWEADECARCVRDGEVESGVMGWGESEAVLRVMDFVRGEGGVGYGELEGVGWDGEEDKEDKGDKGDEDEE
ncbi:hypothetical protein J1614_000097 [Plenodomus biglobosus]|nr:hypothetical protein J1614_000097 [Plenodomus biglobosus]